MQRLANFLTTFNDSEFVFPDDSSVQDSALSILTSLTQDILHDNYIRERTYKGGSMGVSQLGKPAVVTSWDYFYGRDHRVPPTYATKRLWKNGHMFEIDVAYYLCRLGYDVQHQTELSVSEYIADGHPDFVVKDTRGDESTFIVECKHVGDSRYKSWKKYGVNDLAYLTQLALYCSALKCGGMFVIGNSGTGEVRFEAFSYDTILTKFSDSVLRAKMVAELCCKSSSFAETLQYFKPPKPMQRKDGTYYFPVTMYSGKGTLHPSSSLYDYETDEYGKFYINGFNYPNEVKHLEPDFDEFVNS